MEDKQPYQLFSHLPIDLLPKVAAGLVTNTPVETLENFSKFERSFRSADIGTRGGDVGLLHLRTDTLLQIARDIKSSIFSGDGLEVTDNSGRSPAVRIREAAPALAVSKPAEQTKLLDRIFAIRDESARSDAIYVAADDLKYFTSENRKDFLLRTMKEFRTAGFDKMNQVIIAAALIRAEPHHEDLANDIVLLSKNPKISFNSWSRGSAFNSTLSSANDPLKLAIDPSVRRSIDEKIEHLVDRLNKLQGKDETFRDMPPEQKRTGEVRSIGQAIPSLYKEIKAEFDLSQNRDVEFQSSTSRAIVAADANQPSNQIQENNPRKALILSRRGESGHSL